MVGERIVLEVILHQTVPGAEGGQADVWLHHPMKKPVYWSIAVIAAEEGTLATKCVTVAKTLMVKLEFTLPEGEHLLELWVDCDSYIGVDYHLELGKIVTGT
jgi:pre-mRNA-splicing helicase BRR2